MWENVPAVMISAVGPVGVLPQLSHPTYLAMMIGFKLRAWVKICHGADIMGDALQADGPQHIGRFYVAVDT